MARDTTLRIVVSVEPRDFSDREALAIVDALGAAYQQLFQGMAPLGAWLEARVAYAIRQWLPGWCVSHGQVVSEHDGSLQSRSWDLVIHRPVPDEWGYPPPATRHGPWPLVLASLCCAVVDTKTYFSDVSGYVRKKAFNAGNDADVSQLDFLGRCGIPAALLVGYSDRDPVTLEQAGLHHGLRPFVLARGRSPGRVPEWAVRMTPARDGLTPWQAFRQFVEEAAAAHRG